MNPERPILRAGGYHLLSLSAPLALCGLTGATGIGEWLAAIDRKQAKMRAFVLRIRVSI
jgi:hypothetical protein